MGYEQNNGYYQNDGSHDQSWRDQTNVYQTQREQPTPMGRRSPCRKSGWFKGLLAVLLVVAISFGAFYLIRNVGVRLEKTEDGFTLSMTDRTRTPEQTLSAPEDTQQLLPEAAASNSDAPQTGAPASKPESGAYVGSGAKLNIVSAPQSSDTTFSDEEGALCLQDIYSRVIDSVVSISSMTSSGTSSGTGIIMSPDGYVITNHHVIENAQVIAVQTSDDRQFQASIIGSDEASDLAVLKVDATDLQPAEFGDSGKLAVGDRVVAIGDPLGAQLRGTMTSGIVSAINRDLEVNDRTMTLIQTDAALNNGNSGGPLINCYGQVIGINTMKMSNFYSSSTTVEGIGFAIPIDTAKPIIDELIEKGYVSGRPAIGIDGETLPATYRIYYRLPEGIYVTRVYASSDAAAKGISEGDIITAINGIDVTTMEQLNRVKNQFTAGQTVTLTIYRSGSSYDVEIILMDRANA